MAPLPEILAPAGGIEELRAALGGGADAVYLGGRRFGARAFATNFDTDELWRARRATRAMGRRLYVTLNTLVFDRELPALDAELDFLERLGPDALIVQDLGVLVRMRERGSALARHLSTQAAWDGSGGADLLRELGVTRVVLPRETPLPEIRRLAAEAPFELEVFVHGAHCYSVSGRCYWSAALGRRSGNRGTCAQPCRRLYRVGSEESALFSPQDLRLLGRLDELRAAGVAALKIEGRMKDAHYVRSVVETYRAALDGRAQRESLAGVFSREWNEGFADGAPSGWRTRETAGALGEPVARVTGGPDTSGRLAVELSGLLAAGDGVAWRVGRERSGARVTWVGGDGRGLAKVRLHGDATPPAGSVLHRTDRARTGDPTAGYDPAVERAEVTLRFSGEAGSPLACVVDTGEATVAVESAVALDLARGEGLEKLLPQRFRGLAEEVTLRLELGDLAPGLFLPMSALKALRREVREAIAAEQSRSGTEAVAVTPEEDAREPGGPTSVVLRLWQPEAVELLADLRPSGGWVVPAGAQADRLQGSVGFWLPPAGSAGGVDVLARTVAVLPPDAEVLCSSWEAFSLKERFHERPIRLDWTFNVANRPALRAVEDMGLRATSSPELPRPLRGATAVVRLNPLVSLSRFPPEPSLLGQEIRNSHGDRFWLEELTAGLWGLFLERPPVPSLPAAGPVQVDVYLPPDDRARAATLRALRRLLDRI